MTALDKIGTAYVSFAQQLNKRTVRYLHTKENMEALGQYISEKLGEEALSSSDTWLLAWSDLSSEGKLQEPPTPEEIAAERAEKEASRIKRLHEKDRADGRGHKTDAQIAKETEESVRKVKDNEAWFAFWPSHLEYMSPDNAAIMDNWLKSNGRKVSVDSLEVAFNAVKGQLKNFAVKPADLTAFTAYHALGDVSIPFTRPQLLAWMKTQKSGNIIEVKKQYPHLAKRIDAVIVGLEDPMYPPAPPAEGIKING